MQDMIVFINTCKAELVRLGHDRKAVREDEGFIQRSEELWRAGYTGVQAANIVHNEMTGNV